jgi:hypothetical protein
MLAGHPILATADAAAKLSRLNSKAKGKVKNRFACQVKVKDGLNRIACRLCSLMCMQVAQMMFRHDRPAHEQKTSRTRALYIL